jgi:hypothetical protein
MVISQKLCDERHDNIEKEFGAMRKALWTLIILHVTVLGTVIGVLVKALAN